MQNRIDSSFTDLNFATKCVHDSQEKLVLQQVTRVSRNFIQTEVGIIAACNNLIFRFVESKHSTLFALNVATQVQHKLHIFCPFYRTFAPFLGGYVPLGPWNPGTLNLHQS